MVTWDDYIIIYYDVMNLNYFYVVFRKKKEQKDVSFQYTFIFCSTIPLLLFFFNKFWKNIWIINVFFGLYKHFSKWYWKKK